ncbi:MAG: DUF3667 domain-containing protein [Hyphomonadaceae bacterium]
MSGELEAAGAAATAGLTAAAIEGREPHAGVRHGDGRCLNCGAEVSGKFCAECGQPAHVHRTLSHVLEEFLHGILHFDAKAWRTLPLLVARPGTLTHNYIHGKRARYISPLAVFLFTIFLMFFVFAFFTPENVAIGSANMSAMSREELVAREAELRAGETEMRASAANGGAGAAGFSAGAAAMAEAREEVLLEIARRDGKASPAEPELNLVVIDGMEGLNEKFREKLQNPDLLFYKVQQSAYKFSFLLVPISLPFVALLFLWKRGLTLYDHVVFTLYSLAFMSLLFIAASLLSLSSWTSALIGWVIFAGAPLHMFFHVKGTYALGWWSALWRTGFLVLFACISLVIFLVLMILLGVLG